MSEELKIDKVGREHLDSKVRQGEGSAHSDAPGARRRARVGGQDRKGSNASMAETERPEEALMMPTPTRDFLAVHPDLLEELTRACGEPASLRSHFFGFDVVSSPFLPARQPRLKLSPSFKWCSEKFRREFNAWALEAFGTEAVGYVFSGLAGPQCVRFSRVQDPSDWNTHDDEGEADA